MGVLAGIENMEEAIKKIADGGPEVITMHKGLARQYFLPQAARVYLKRDALNVLSFLGDKKVISADACQD